MTAPRNLVSEARRLSDAATPGPWAKWNDLVVNQDGDDCKTVATVDWHYPAAKDKDAEFIAWCRAGVPARCDRIEELEDALRELITACTHDENDKNYRPLGDTYGWCSVCGTKVGYKENIARDALKDYP